DLMHHAGAPVLLGQPVAVGHKGAASGHIELGFPRMKRDAQVVDEKVAAPAVVVAAHERDGHAAGAQGVELRDRAEVTARDHRAILEPEVEQVAVDEERVPEIRHRVEEAVKRGRDRGRDLAEMSVRDDDHAGGGQWHGPQASAVPTIHANVSEPVRGLTYKELEQQGVYLAVSEVSVRYRAAARYDDLVKVRCWVRELASRRVTFGYAVERAGTGELLATGETSLVSLTHQHTLTRLP